MTKLVVIIISVILTAIVVTVISLLVSYSEYKNWNGGVCPNCGEKLRYFDTDSQGGEGWTCDKCNHTAWVSYHNLVYKFWKRHYKNKS
jgi:predicted RNA-binding Zn-ribbon protein involved in translation (DUF1610 family)